MRALSLMLLATTLAGCGSPSSTTAPSVAEAAPAAQPAAATYQFDAATAAARWGEVAPLKASLGGADAQGCEAFMADVLSVRICSAGGKVTSMVATSRGPKGAALLDKSVATMAGLVAPDAEPADLRRVSVGAADAVAKSGTTLCPTTRCFKVQPVAGGWVLGADASA